jgi:uncharacterized protein Veg
MRKSAMSIEEAKRQIGLFTGESLRIAVNKGRKKVSRYEGTVTAVYPSVFTLQILDGKTYKTLSCSYSDYICGEVGISKKL